jgi:hypothetical protein
MTHRSVLGIVLALLLLYGATRALPILSGPVLTVTSPPNYASFAEGYVPIEGVAKYTETLTLNGGPLLIDENGRFATTLLLPRGGAILTLTATDRFGRQVTEKRTVLIP